MSEERIKCVRCNTGWDHHLDPFVDGYCKTCSDKRDVPCWGNVYGDRVYGYQDVTSKEWRLFSRPDGIQITLDACLYCECPFTEMGTPMLARFEHLKVCPMREWCARCVEHRSKHPWALCKCFIEAAALFRCKESESR